MNKQLNIPIAIQPLLNPAHLATNMKNQLDQEISRNINRLMRKKVVFSRSGSELQPINGWDIQTPDLKAKHFKPSSEQTTVAGVDSSCIHIAETDDGSVYAGRAAAVFSQHGKLSSYVRIGPIIYYIDEFNASKISFEVSGSSRFSKLFLLDRSLAQRVVRERLERAVALELAKMLSRSVILIDGCLKSSKFEERETGLRRVLEAADKNDDVVVGLSKTTRVGLLNRLSQVLYASKDLPAYLDVDGFVSPFLSRVEGRILLARFSEDGYPYRVDISSPADVEASLSLLMSSDTFYHGYPETLRIAHHLSVFNATQSDSIKSYLVRNVGVVEVPSEDFRQATLGSMSFRSGL
ncbi:MAG: DNA double-strand break repair nuclease NurA [Nitrososphaerales archaeon]